MNLVRVKLLKFNVATAIACLAGCSTTLSVQRIDGVKFKSAPSGSISYILPKKQILINATYVLKSCTTSGTDDKPQLHLNVEATATVSAGNAPDQQYRYFIPYDAMRSGWKETSITLQNYPNKTLKSINVTINDQTGPIVTSALGSLIQIGALANAGGGVKDLCNDDAIVALNQLSLSQKKLLAITSTAGVKKTGASSASSATTSSPGTGNGPAPADKAAAASSDVPSQNSAITSTQAEISTIVSEKLTSHVTLVWTPLPSEVQKWTDDLDAATLVLSPHVAVSKWLTKDGLANFDKSADASAKTNFVVAVSHWDHPEMSEVPLDSADGLVLRDPALGSLYVCKGPCPAPSAQGSLSDNVQSITAMAFPQLGRNVVVPLQNGILQNSVLDLSLSEDGIITTIGLHQTGTIAPTLTAVGTDFASENAVLTGRNNAANAAKTAASPTSLNTNLANCLTAQATIIKNGGTPAAVCK